MSVMHPNYDLLPEHMQDAMRMWVEHGIEPGSFLMAVLENDLMMALGKADHMNINRLKDYGNFLYNEVPSACFGSKNKCAAWAKRGGMRGHTKIEAA